MPTPMKTIALTLLALASAAAPANAAQPAPWQPVPGLTQIPLWPEGLAIQRPETTESETSGHGSGMVAGRPWTWAGNVSRPTMTMSEAAKCRSV